MNRITVILAIFSLFLCSCGDSDNPVKPDDPDVSFSFVHHQDISTSGAADFEAFEIGAETYLAVANASNGSTVNIDSKIYRWVDTSFVEFQSIPTSQATDWEYFSIDSDSYIAVANYYSTAGDSYNVDSKIYLWNGTSFVEHQGVPTSGAQAWEYFTIDGDHYLGCANLRNETEFQINSIILKGIPE